MISNGDESYFTGGMRVVADKNGDAKTIPMDSSWGDQGGSNAVPQGTPAQDDDDYRYGFFGYWQYTQHVVVYDNSTPVATVDAPVQILYQTTIVQHQVRL